VLTLFDPQPPTSALPDRVPSPFATPPHPLAARAIEALRRDVAGLAVDLDAPGAGKMFGVLVVATPDGRIGYLRAFSGMLAGSWHIPGFAPPVFDDPARSAFWPAGEAELAVIDRELRELDVATVPDRAALTTLDERHRVELAEMNDRHAVDRRARHRARDHIRMQHAAEAETTNRVARGVAGDEHPSSDRSFESVPSGSISEHASRALDEQSRRDGSERKRLLERHERERAPLAARLRLLDAERSAIERGKADRSRELLVAIYQTYAFANARDERRSLHDLFAPGEPPGGAGDCAAPKLLALAYRERLRPIALAEIWCGAPPATGGRHDGTFYPACRGKCGPIVTHQLGGLACEEIPIFGIPSVGDDEPRTVFEDEWIAVVEKPVGLLSVPGRSGLLKDSVLSRLRIRYPDATGPLLVHRLDLDTSGLLLAAKDQQTYGALQEMFARRLVEKRYIAWLEGNVAGDRGTIELALRVDLDDRPRQIHDPVHGKPAVTDWQVLERIGTRTRVALWPRTGRTHQLRVHAAHPLGLDAPIIGDRLYARDAHEPRMLLHAEQLAFTHPQTKDRLEFVRASPF
jgi:tRNA pseudouridine32 synthase / 23S rRNA pseudouridine746 synthase